MLWSSHTKSQKTLAVLKLQLRENHAGVTSTVVCSYLWHTADVFAVVEIPPFSQDDDKTSHNFSLLALDITENYLSHSYISIVQNHMVFLLDRLKTGSRPIQLLQTSVFLHEPLSGKFLNSSCYAYIIVPSLGQPSEGTMGWPSEGSPLWTLFQWFPNSLKTP